MPGKFSTDEENSVEHNQMKLVIMEYQDASTNWV